MTSACGGFSANRKGHFSPRLHSVATAASLQVDIECGASHALAVALLSGQLVEDADLQSDELSDGVLNSGDDPRLRFITATGAVLPLDRLLFVFFEPSDGSIGPQLTTLFALEVDGTIRTNDPVALLDQIAAFPGGGALLVAAGVVGGTQAEDTIEVRAAP